MHLTDRTERSDQPVSPEFSALNNLVVVGLNYHSCPIAIRERFMIPAYCLSHALYALKHMPSIREAAVLSTCNRTEVFAVVSNLQSGLKELEAFFASTQQIADHAALKPNFKLLRDDVALHLMRVASGLDSMIVGEGQIMSQVKAAQRAALDAGASGPVLDQLFKFALTCGKRVRSETSMGRRAVSVSSAAVELSREVCGGLTDKSVLVIGAGKMATICVKHLLSESGETVIANRSPERIGTLLEDRLPNGERLKPVYDFNQRYALAGQADILIVSTSSPEHVIKAHELQAALGNGKQLCIIDISVPRNVDPAVANIPGVKLFHADDLAAVVNRNLAEREALVEEAERIVFETLEDFHAWQRSFVVAPTIRDLRRKIESIRQQQIERRAGADAEDEISAEHISRAIVNQILHAPTVQLKATLDQVQLRQHAEALRKLFDLDIFASTESGCPVTVEKANHCTGADAQKALTGGRPHSS